MRAIALPHKTEPAAPAPPREKPGTAGHVKGKGKRFAVEDARPHPKKSAKKPGKAVATGPNAPAAAPAPFIPGLPAPVKTPDGGPRKSGTGTGKEGSARVGPARGSPDTRHASPKPKAPVPRLRIPPALGTTGGATPAAKPVLIRQVTLPPAKPAAPPVVPTPAPAILPPPNSGNPPAPVKGQPATPGASAAAPAAPTTTLAVPAAPVTLSAPTAASVSHHARTSSHATAPPAVPVIEPHAARGWVVRPQYWHHQPGADVSRWKIAPPAGQGQPMILTLTQARDSFQARLDVTPPDGAWVAQVFAPQAVHALQGQMNGHGVALSQVSVFTTSQGAPQGGGNGSGGLFQSGGRSEPPARPGYQTASGYTGGHGEGVDYRA